MTEPTLDLLRALSDDLYVEPTADLLAGAHQRHRRRRRQRQGAAAGMVGIGLVAATAVTGWPTATSSAGPEQLGVTSTPPAAAERQPPLCTPENATLSIALNRSEFSAQAERDLATEPYYGGPRREAFAAVGSFTTQLPGGCRFPDGALRAGFVGPGKNEACGAQNTSGSPYYAALRAAGVEPVLPVLDPASARTVSPAVEDRPDRLAYQQQVYGSSFGYPGLQRFGRIEITRVRMGGPCVDLVPGTYRVSVTYGDWTTLSEPVTVRP